LISAEVVVIAGIAIFRRRTVTIYVAGLDTTIITWVTNSSFVAIAIITTLKTALPCKRIIVHQTRGVLAIGALVFADAIVRTFMTLSVWIKAIRILGTQLRTFVVFVAAEIFITTVRMLSACHALVIVAAKLPIATMLVCATFFTSAAETSAGIIEDEATMLGRAAIVNVCKSAHIVKTLVALAVAGKALSMLRAFVIAGDGVLIALRLIRAGLIAAKAILITLTNDANKLGWVFTICSAGGDPVTQAVAVVGHLAFFARIYAFPTCGDTALLCVAAVELGAVLVFFTALIIFTADKHALGAAIYIHAIF
tara:strand:+ start:1872 stop:2801 length:930 start_codon:yes stop_codon:yes gene_type:complete